MFHKKSYRFISLISVMILLTNVLPVQAKTPASPLSASGDLLWAKSMGGVSDDFGLSITTDSSGNVFTTGSYQGTADFDPSAGTANLSSAGIGDIFITKFDSSGNLVWAKSMGGTADDAGGAIAVDTSGNIYTTGYFAGTADFDPGAGTANFSSAGIGDIFITKFDSSGNLVWAKSMGGTADDASNAIAVDASGNIYTTGYFEGTADFDPSAGIFNLTNVGGDDIFVSKLDSNGNFVWAKSMGGTSAEAGRGIGLDTNGNVYTTGFFQVISDFDPGVGTFNLTPAGSLDIFISKLDSNGNFVWAKSMGGTSLEIGLSIILDSSGNVYTTGFFNSTVDFDPGAGTYDLTSVGAGDIFISKLDSSGNFIWAKGMGGTSDDLGRGIAVDSSGNVYSTGFFSSSADFDPAAGTFNLNSAGLNDVFVSELDSSGNFVWAKGMGGTDEDFGIGIALDSSTNVYTTGFFGGTADFDPGVGIANLTSTGLNDIFISKLEASSNQAIQVTIDIKPGSQSNPINPKSTGTTPVAILSTKDFNAPLKINKASLTFGRTGAEVSLSSCDKKGQDVNGDGLLDLICHFKTKLTGFQVGDIMGILKGQTLDGVSIEGRDSVKIVPSSSYP